MNAMRNNFSKCRGIIGSFRGLMWRGNCWSLSEMDTNTISVMSAVDEKGKLDLSLPCSLIYLNLNYVNYVCLNIGTFLFFISMFLSRSQTQERILESDQTI